MNKAVLRAGNVYRVNNGKVQYILSGYYPEEKKVLLKFGRIPIKASIDILHGVAVDGFLLKQYGFKNDPFNTKFWQKDDLIVYLIGKGEFRVAFQTKIYVKVYKYFHQLQNIYHAHTADELSFCFG